VDYREKNTEEKRHALDRPKGNHGEISRDTLLCARIVFGDAEWEYWIGGLGV